MNATSNTRSEELIERLRLICGRNHVLSDRATLGTYSSDALLHHRQLPLAVALPGTVAECQAVLRACAETATAFVARGAGTGLAGGAVPVENCVLVATTRLRGPVQLDRERRLATAPAGASILEIQRAAAPTLHFPPRPSSLAAATVGGAIATAALGAQAYSAGALADYVQRLDVVLADGTLVALSAADAGYDLLGAFVGSEGTLGLVVRAQLRLEPAPEQIRLLRADFASLTACVPAAQAVTKAGVVPAALEARQQADLALLSDGRGARWQAPATGEQRCGTALSGAALLIELAGSAARCEQDSLRAHEACLLAGAEAVAELADPAPLWQLHAELEPALGRVCAGRYPSDLAVPPSALPELIQRSTELAEAATLRTVARVCPLDGTLQSTILYDPTDGGQSQAAQELARAIASVALAAGGALGGEHGIGLDKLALASDAAQTGAQPLARRLRAAFDPAGLANPTKLLAGVDG